MDSLPAELLGKPLLSFSSVQSLSHVQLFATSRTTACQASLSITNSWSLLKLMSIETVMPCNYLILCRPFSFGLQSFPASGSFQMSQFFASGGQSTGVSASAFSPSNEYSGLISFRMDWLDLFASILQCSALFIVQLSHSYMTIGKTIALTRWTFVGNVSAC